MRRIYLGFAITISTLVINFATIGQEQPRRPAQPPRKVIEQAKKLAEEGNKFYRERNYRMAVDRFQKVTNLLPDYSFPVVYFNKGASHFYLQQYELAVTSLNKAFEQGYSPIEIQKIRWYANYAVKDYDGALRDAQEVAKVEPNNSLVLMGMGDIYRDRGMFKEAVIAYEKASTLLPNNADLYYLTADCYARLGDSTKTGVTALKAVQKNTRYLGESWFLIGSAFYIQKKFNDSADAFERAIAAKPELIAAYGYLSEIYQSQNRLEEAITITKKGIELNPRDGSLYSNLAWLLSLADRHIEAIGAGKKAVEFAPDQYMGHTNLCRAYMDAGQHETALQICNNALKLKPDDGETYYYIGKIYSFQKKNDLANASYRKAVSGLIAFTKERPDYSDGYYLLGNAYLALSQVASAIATYKKCLELNPTFPQVLFNLGYSYVLNGDKKSARDQHSLLLKVDSERASKLLSLIQAN